MAVDLVFDTGQRVRVSGPGLLGRNPQSADPHVVCTAVEDPDMSISKTHLEVGVDVQGFWVRDRGSTNGSALLDNSGQPRRLEAGVSVHPKIGDIVTMGHRRFRVDEARLG
ncbi:MAG: FHA domain-containing protein [Propionibacteriaceae bacterium]|nr:FHA domain-containing protein [Propionibacteriaceae bacterium]